MYITYKYLKAHIFNKREKERERKRGIQIEKKEYRERERERGRDTQRHSEKKQLFSLITF